MTQLQANPVPTQIASSDFIHQLDAVIQKRHLLDHAFYQMWNRGELTLEMLRQYAQEYFLQVKAFPTYVSATHSNCDDLEIRKMLLENLIEEEHGLDNHPELWQRFAEALGVSRSQLAARAHLPQTQESVAVLQNLTRNPNPAIGLAALYAYESQVPEIAKTKIAGLKQFYGIDSQEGLAFFSVHQEADVVHRQVTQSTLAKLCQTPEQQQAVLKAAEQAADALNLLLDGVYETWCQEAVAA